MSYRLFDLTLMLARLITDVTDGVATGGSDTTLIDTLFPVAAPPDDHYNNGTIWMRSCANEGKTAVITDWAQGTYTFSFATLGMLNAAGDLYSAATSDYPRHQLRQFINRALSDIGRVPATYEDATFVTVANQEEYTLPSGVSDIYQVWIANGTTTPYDYVPHYGWTVRDGKLRFDTNSAPAVDSYRIRLIYPSTPSWLTTDAGTISDFLNPERVVWKAAVHALRWRMMRTRQDEPYIVDMLNEALKTEVAYDQRYPVPVIERDPHMGSWGERPL